MTENEKLRGLLKTCLDIGELPTMTRGRIEAALSRQAEPVGTAPFDLHEFARRADIKMREHDFYGFEPVVLAVVGELLGVEAEPTRAQTAPQPEQHDTKGSRKALGTMNAKLRAKVGRLERELAALSAQGEQ